MLTRTRAVSDVRCGGQVIKGLEDVLGMAERALEGKQDVKMFEDVYRCEGRMGE